MSQFVAPSGYVDLDNDCEFSIDRKSTRSRESVNPKEDLAFYFNTYIVPKYQLQNLNVSNVASFMKELEMNWTKLSPSLQGNVMDILVDGILNKDSSFKTAFLQKLQIQLPATPVQAPINSSFTNVFSKSSFGKSSNNILLIGVVIAVALYFMNSGGKTSYGRLS
jgi:hypothetical protein